MDLMYKKLHYAAVHSDRHGGSESIIGTMTTLSVLLVLVLALVTGCEGRSEETCRVPGWFGPDCVYKCHCQQTLCDGASGECTEGTRCEDGYTGTSCQYSDIAFRRSTSVKSDCQWDGNSSAPVDGDRVTCLTARATGSGPCSWSVALTGTFVVTQIHVKIPRGTADNNTWQVRCHNDRNSTTTEARRQKWSSSDDYLTYLPPHNFFITRIEIVTPSQKELKLCEVNVLGGRNVVLKKNATQGNQTFNKTSGAEKAVSDEGRRHYRDQCAIAKTDTDRGQPLAWWKVVLGQNVLAWQVEVHTPPASEDMTIIMSSNNGSTWDLHVDIPRQGIVLTKPVLPVQPTEVVITRRDRLSLCEVRVLGDCLDGYFGWLCDHRCNCSSPEEVCDKVWGTCRRPRCEMGWQGPRCQQACLPGTYGTECSETCSKNCVNRGCSPKDGTCTQGCHPGWEGDKCQRMCSSGFYGNACGHNCSSSCLDALCDPVSGSCTHGCVSGMHESFCSEEVTLETIPDRAATSTGVMNIVLILAGVVTVCLATTAVTVMAFKRRVKKRKASEAETQMTNWGDRSTPWRGHVTERTSHAPSRQSDTRHGRRSTQRLPLIKHEEMIADTRPPSAANWKLTSKTDQDGVDVVPDALSEACSSSDASDTDLYYQSYIEVDVDTFKSSVVAVRDFPSKVARWLSDPEHFRKERSALPEGKRTHSKTAALPQNIIKMRYREIYLYDHSRVILKPLPDDPSSDFYDASYIDGYAREKEYIAAQGPIQKTVDDFLRMVWDVGCPCIVMLANTEEMGRVKCHQYWPVDGATFSTQNVTVTNRRTSQFADFCIRDLILERGGQTKEVKMFHYTAWPANLPPSSPWSLLDFRSKVRQVESTKGPTIVHCSAGIGRTGTFLALDILLTRAEVEGVVDVFTCVWVLRQQRAGMVQTLTQYMFIFEALAAALVTSVPVSVENFNLNRWLSNKDKENLMEKEYKNLKMFVESSGAEGNVCHADPSSCHEISQGTQRVSVFAVDKHCTPVYVDAVFFSGYLQERAFIQTHSPQDGDVISFLSIVCQHHVSKIICLDTAADKSAIYWPDKGRSSVTFEPYQVELLDVKEEQGVVARILRIHLLHLNNYMNEDGISLVAQEWHDFTHYSLSTSPDTLLRSSQISVELKALIHVAQPIPQGPVLVHCRDGQTHSGLFCVLCVTLERMRLNGEVAISYVTGHMSMSRRRMIISQEQFKSIFHMIGSELDANGGETPLKTSLTPAVQ